MRAITVRELELEIISYFIIVFIVINLNFILFLLFIKVVLFKVLVSLF